MEMEIPVQRVSSAMGKDGSLDSASSRGHRKHRGITDTDSRKDLIRGYFTVPKGLSASPFFPPKFLVSSSPHRAHSSMYHSSLFSHSSFSAKLQAPRYIRATVS